MFAVFAVFALIAGAIFWRVGPLPDAPPNEDAAGTISHIRSGAAASEKREGEAP